MPGRVVDPGPAASAVDASFAPLLQALQCVVLAEISTTGTIVAGNAGFWSLLRRAPGSSADDVADNLINPPLAELLARVRRAAPGEIAYRGLVTVVDDFGASHSLLGTVFRQGDHLGLLAEHDVHEYQRLSVTVMQLNDELADQQRALTRANHQLGREKAEQARLLKELVAAQTQLVQAAKLASVGQLAAGVAHEINNPLAFVQANLTTLGHYVSDLFAVVDAYAAAAALVDRDHPLLAAVRRERQRCDIDFVRQDADAVVAESAEGIARVARIVRDLKDFSRINESEWQQVDLHACLESTLNVCRHKLDQATEVVREYGALPALHCCPSQLNQVFMSLLVNAMQAIGDGPGRIFLRTGRTGDEGWLEIEDTGHGIAADVLPRIFDPFFSTRPVGQGTGLGLSSAWGIVNQHGGRIDVRSEVGRGSCFRICLPLAPTAAAARGDSDSRGAAGQSVIT